MTVVTLIVLVVSEAIIGYSDVNDNKNGSVNYDDGNYKKGEV